MTDARDRRRAARRSARATRAGRTAARSAWCSTAVPRCARSPKRSRAMFLHENALNTAAFPSLGEIQSEVVGACARPLPRRARRGGIHDLGRHRERADGGQGRARAGARRARHHRARDGRRRTARTPRSTRRAHYFGVRVHTVPVRADFRADVDAMAACVNDEHRAASSARRRSTRKASSTPSRSSPSSRRPSARRCTSTRAWAGSCCRSWS